MFLSRFFNLLVLVLTGHLRSFLCLVFMTYWYTTIDLFLTIKHTFDSSCTAHQVFEVTNPFQNIIRKISIRFLSKYQLLYSVFFIRIYILVCFRYLRWSRFYSRPADGWRTEEQWKHLKEELLAVASVETCFRWTDLVFQVTSWRSRDM